MENKYKSLLRKIFIGVAIAVISAFIISYLNINGNKKNLQDTSEKEMTDKQNNHSKLNETKINKELSKVKRNEYPQNWEGDYHQVGYAKPYPMKLHIEKLDEFTIRGKVNWPSINNTIANMSGKVIKRPIKDFVEQVKWNIIDEYVNHEDGILIKFTETSIITGKGIDLNGAFYCNLTLNGEIKGHWFGNGSSTSGGRFTLTKK